MSTTPSLPAAPLPEQARRAVRRLGAWRVGAIAYLVLALTTGALLGAPVAALVWGAIELRRHHRSHVALKASRYEPGGFRPSKGLVELVLGAVVINRDGVIRPLFWTLFASLVGLGLAVAALVAIVAADRGLPVVLGLCLVGVVALWRKDDRKRHPEDYPPKPGDVTIAAYVESHSFPSDTVADFVTSETGRTISEQARERLDAWRSGYLAAERDARRRRREAARKGRDGLGTGGVAGDRTGGNMRW